MADELKRVGLVFKADGTTDFAKSLTQINALTKENYNSFKLAQSQYDKNTSSVSKLTDTQKYLSQNTELYRNKVAVLEEELKELESAENRNESAIAKKKAQLDKAKTTLNNYEKGLEEVNARLESGSAQLQDYADKIGQASEKMKNVGTTMTKYVSAPILALGTASMMAWNEIDEAYDNIILKTGATGDSLESLKDSFDNVYGSFPFDSEEVANAIGEVNTRFKLTGRELENLSSYLLEYSSITGTDVAESTAYAQKIQQQWGLTLEDTKNVLGLIAYQGQATGISIDTLMDSVTENSYAFKEMGLSVEESINLMAQFEANGLEADAMLTGLKKASQNYAKEGKSMSEGLGELITRLQNSTTYQEAFNEAVDLFGSKNALAFATAAKEGKINLDSLSADLSNYSNVVSDTFNSTQDPIDRAKVAMNNLKIAGTELGDSIQGALAPILEKLAEIAKDLADWFSNLSPVIKEIIVVVGGLIASIGPLLVIIGTIGGAVSNALSMLSNLTLQLFMNEGAISAIATALGGLSAPVLAVIALIGTLVVALVDLWNNSETFRQNVTSIVTNIGTVLSSVYNSMIAPILSGVMAILQSLWNTIISPLYEFIKTVLETLMSKLSEFVAFMTPIIQSIANLLNGPLKGAVDLIVAVFTTSFSIISSVVSTAFSVIQAVWNSVLRPVFSVISSVINTLLSLFRTIFSGISSVVTTCFNTINSIWNGTLGPVFKAIGKAIQTLQNAFSSGFNAISNITGSIFGGIASTIGGKMSNATNIVTNAISAIRGAFNFSWSLPHLSLPHISISGGFSLKPLSVPHFSISWYRKAMNSPMLLNDATIFGMANGQLLGGGEASGTEVIAGEAKLMSMIQNAMGTSENVSVLKAIYNLLLTISKNSDKPIVLDSGALVGYLIGNIDNELGGITQMKLRGVK